MDYSLFLVLFTSASPRLCCAFVQVLKKIYTWYVKNIKAEDSQVSLWGGDAVFNNLDLRLDVLEDELRLPFSLVSGHIHELQIHVPWTRLNTEPIVLTINTIECVLKLPSDRATSGFVFIFIKTKLHGFYFSVSSDDTVSTEGGS